MMITHMPTAAEDLQSIYGESFLAHKGFKRDRIAWHLALSHLASFFLGPFLGILTDHMLVFSLDCCYVCINDRYIYFVCMYLLHIICFFCNSSHLYDVGLSQL